MKTAWLGSVLFHLAMAGGLLWLATAHPIVHEAVSAGAVLVALVESPDAAVNAGSSAPVPTAVAPARRSRVQATQFQHPAPPVHPVQAGAVPASAASEPVAAAPVSLAGSVLPPEVTVPDHAPASDGAVPSSTPTDTIDTGPAAGLEATRARSEERREGIGETAAAKADPWTAYFAGVRAAVERAKHYPFSARMAGLEDRVTVAFSIMADGEAEQIRVTDPSRFPVLNDAAIDTIRRAGRFPAPPLRDNQSGVRVTVPLEFALHPHGEALPQ
ncbi:MAG TPA: TonB family protein [Nitrospiria bacterium]|nr:TonB family protein [Nitrospiria bacterium]